MTIKEYITKMTNEALAQITIAEYGEGAFFNTDVKECQRLCKAYFLKGRRYGKPEVKSGFLFIEGQPMGRITSLPFIKGASEKELYYEGRCLTYDNDF